MTVLVADSSPLTLLGLAESVRRSPRLLLAGQQNDGPSMLAALRCQHPAVAVIDAHLDDPDGCEITRCVRAEQLGTAVLLIAERPAGELVLQCFTAGAAGFLSKRTSLDAFTGAIHRIARGESVLSSDVGASLADVVGRRGETDYTVPTRREIEILRHLARGETAAAIAQHLGVSTPTIKTHIQNLYLKFGVNDRAAAVATAIRRGLIA